MLDPKTEREYLHRIPRSDDPVASRALLVSQVRLVLSLSRERVRRLEMGATEKLREVLLDSVA